MSGDVQPRKRKDKKKKKDIIEEAVIQHPTTAPIPQPSDDINIHVYKETTTGGGICAKCVFFILMIGIGGLIGFLITEHRGQTDLDIAKSESRFAQFFEGWVDKSHDDHDADHSDEVTYDDDHDESDSEELEASEEQEASEEEEASDEREESEEDEASEPDDDDEVSEEEIEEEQNDSEDVEQSEEQIQDDDEEEEVEAEESEEQEIEADASEEQEVGADTSEEQNDDSDEKVDASVETIKDDDDGDEEKGESEENLYVKEEGEKQQPELTTTAVAVKVGVGVALFVVAYVVLVRKWKSDKISDKPDKEAQMPDYSRRNTIVPPPTLEEIEQDIENIEEEYSEDEDEESDDDAKVHIPAAKKNYEELRSRYSRSLTPESEQEVQGKSEEYEEEDEEYDEEGDDRELISDEDEEIDEELMQKLEAKYGKLNTGKHYEEEEEDEDNEDFESWKRVKVLPDNGAESESDDEKNVPKKRSGAQSLYEFDNITNTNDYNIKDDLDKAHRHLSDNVPLALSLFDQILDKHPYSPRGLFGKAHALDLLAEKKRSNDLLQESIKFYLFVLQEKDVPDPLFLAAAERSINRMRFVGQYGKAVAVHKMLIRRFPNDVKFRNQLAVTYLTTNRISDARLLLLETLQKWPNDGFGLVHYGFILKTTDNDLTKSIDYLQKGINTRNDGVIDGRFYFHLGDALARLGRTEEAMKVYEEGVENKVFLSKYQRSLYNVDRLTGRPWWKQQQTPYKQLYDKLEQNWKEIRSEGLSVLNKKGYFKDEAENLKDTGDWKQFELFARGIKHVENCKKCPITCNIVDKTPYVKGCKRGQVKFSVMHPGTHVWPHCGPTNCRLRVHLGLKVPANTFIRVAKETRSWEDGKVIIFDDSFEHEVWHNGTGFRLVLIVDVWHPELTQKEKQTLSAI